ncbi:hypothetical protein ACHAWF_011741 [Thalassiosira exigua]
MMRSMEECNDANDPSPVNNNSASVQTGSTHDGSTATPCAGHGITTTKQQPDIDDSIEVCAVISTTVRDDVCETYAEKWNRWKIVTLYLVTITILFADMNLLAPNLSIIADEFGMDDEERDVKLGGLIALGFFFVGAPISFIVGWLADSRNRSPLFAACVALGEFGCFMVTFVESYWQLYLCRVMTGASIGGAIPVIYSVLGDMYPAKQRAAIAAVITTGTGLGMGVGQAMVGSMDSWRLPFLIVSIPGLICSVLLLYVKDPKRGAKEAAVLDMRRHHRQVAVPSTLSESERRGGTGNNLESRRRLENCGMEYHVSVSASSPWKLDRIEVEPEAVEVDEVVDDAHVNGEEPATRGVSCKSTLELMKIPSVLLTVLQAAPGALPFGFCATFFNDFLQEQRGMTKQEATGVLLTFGVGNAIGVIIGGFLGHFTYKRDVRGPPFVMGISLILGCIPFYFLLNNVDENASTGVVAGITILSGMLVVIPVPLERSILTNVCLPKSRGRANAIVGIVDDLGKGLGPALVSLLITSFDRQTAFNISLLGWIIGGLLSLAIMLFIAKDEESVQQQIREKLARADIECPSGIEDISL